jgi:hypothetical protein
MNNESKFSNGFILGLLIGGGLVFLLGTKTGKNITKIISDQGLDGLLSLLDEYDVSNLEEEEEGDEEEFNPEVKTNSVKEDHQVLEEEEEVKPTPKKRFFKRLRK